MTDSEKRPILSEPVVSGQPHPPNYQSPPDYQAPPNYQNNPAYPQLPPPVAMTQPEFGTIQGKRVCSVEGHRDWSSGLFDCTEDMTNCLMVWCCGPCVMCQLASRLGEFACFPLCVPGGNIVLRTRVRTLGGIRGSICSDCMTMACCGPCGLCQIKREMDQMDIY